MTIVAEKPVAGGSCLARIEGKAVFIPFVLPGETAEIEIVEDRKDWAKARLIKVLESSPRRIEPLCPLFGLCGGCTMQMADAAYQSELRAAVAADSLRRAGCSYSGPIAVISGEPFGYRARAQFHHSSDGSPGFSAARSAEIVPIKDCPVLVTALRDALKDGTIAEAMSRFVMPGGLRRGNGGRRNNLKNQERFQVFSSGEKLFYQGGNTEASATLGGKTLYFDVRGFFQSNLHMLERMIFSVTENLNGPGQLLDFYAGVGTFSAFAGPRLGNTVLVEHNGAALEFARRNIDLPADSIELCAVSDEAWALHPSSRKQFSLAIMDPPRQGLARPSLDWFTSSAIPEIRYVSCDPVTFARDAALLERAGFALESLSLFDFYPQTHHAEVYGRFAR